MKRRALPLSQLAALLGLCGCTSKLEPLYCEGGVYDGRMGGGDCLSIDARKVDADPATVGSAVLMSRYKERFSLRRVDASRYELYSGGTLVGSFTRDGARLTLTMKDTGKPQLLRSDRLGAFF